MLTNRKLIYSLYSGITALILIVVLLLFNLFESLELKTLDARFRIFSKPETASKNIVFAVIDDKSIQSLEKQNMYWPWSRDVYAELVGYFKRGGAKAVMFDILFPSPDIDRVSSNGEDNDKNFADSMKSAQNVLLGLQLKEDIAPSNYPMNNSVEFSFPHDAVSSKIFSSSIAPYPLFQSSAKNIGVVNYHSDDDGICRRLPLLSYYNRTTFPHLGFTAFLFNKHPSITFEKEKKTLKVENQEIPLDNEGNFLIWWYGKGGIDGCFKYYSIQSLIHSAIQEKRSHQPIVPSDSFKDKYVIVGSNASALLDFRTTPFTQEEPYPGMEIYATMLSNLLQKDFLRIGNKTISILAIFAFCFLVAFAMFYVHRVIYTISLVIILSIAWVGISCYFFSSEKIWIELAAPLCSILCSFAISATWSYSTEGKARKQLRSMFHRYVDATVVEQLEAHPEKLELGGVETEAVVFFSDIEQFTIVSEQLQPKDVVKHLNEYFSLSVDVLLKHNAFLDKYYGDAVMAMFGVPIQNNNDAHYACLASLEIIQSLKSQPMVFNRARIGLHSGKMLVGNIGSVKRTEYTAIGDTVNVASRLESVNKIYGTSIIISEQVYSKVHNDMICRELDIVTLKGKGTATRIFELLCTKKLCPQETTTLVQQFGLALQQYRNKSFVEAKNSFSQLLKQFPDDNPAKVFINRCNNFISSPPPQEWNGVYDLESK